MLVRLLADYLLLLSGDSDHLSTKRDLIRDCMISAGWHDHVITGSGNEQSEKRRMNMNKDILKGKKREITGGGSDKTI